MNEQTRYIAQRLWATVNAKNLLVGGDVFEYPWGTPRSAMHLKYEAKHKVQHSLLIHFRECFKNEFGLHHTRECINSYTYRRVKLLWHTLIGKEQTASWCNICSELI